MGARKHPVCRYFAIFDNNHKVFLIASGRGRMGFGFWWTIPRVASLVWSPNPGVGTGSENVRISEERGQRSSIGLDWIGDNFLQSKARVQDIPRIPVSN